MAKCSRSKARETRVKEVQQILSAARLRFTGDFIRGDSVTTRADSVTTRADRATTRADSVTTRADSVTTRAASVAYEQLQAVPCLMRPHLG